MCVCTLLLLCLSPSPDVRGQEGCRWSSFPSDSDRKGEIARERSSEKREREREKINGACEEQKDREERERERESDKRQLRGSSRPNSGNIANTQLCLRGRSVQGN